jgi:UPF0755 protein
MKRLVKIALILLVVIVVVGAASILRSLDWLRTPIAALAAPTPFEIERGSSLRTVAGRLHAQGLLEHPQLLAIYARFTDQARGIKAGEYLLEPGMTPAAILDLFQSGKVILHGITFVEGTTFAEMRRLLAAHPDVDVTRRDASDAEIMSILARPDVAPEGQFFPDTYHFPKGTTDIELLALAMKRMRAALDSAWETRAPDLPLATPYEALVLASIIEKETALDSERPVIAGVFIQRLRLGMRLQSDPTVIYGLGDGYDGDIRRRDLVRDTPYNTYTRTGLPPTPIAAPGAESLAAVVKPEVTGALYFVATGDGDGSHYFSRTLAEHEAAVRRYLVKMRSRR